MRHLPFRWAIAARRLLAGAAMLAACTQDPAAAENARVRDEIKAEIAKGVHALRTKNIDEYLGQIPDEVFAHDSTSGVDPRERIRNEVQVTWASIDTTRILDIRIDSVMAHGDSATVVTTMKWDRLIKTGPTQRDTLITSVKHREIWRRTKQGWRSVKLVSATGGTKRNGKPTGG